MRHTDIQGELLRFYKRRNARLRSRLKNETELLRAVELLRAIHRNRKSIIELLKTEAVPQKSLDIGGKSSTMKLPATEEDGGPGSGNHGHKGVPGQVGGSAPSASAEGPNKPCIGFKDAATAKRHKKHWTEFGFTSHEQYEKAAIEFLRKPVGGDIDGYVRPDGCVVRFNVNTCELALGYPGRHIRSYYIAKYDAKTGKPNETLANNYFNKMKKEEADEDG